MAYDDAATWSIFTLSGVPRDLFKYCRELAQLARERGQIVGLKYARFDLDRVLETERSIRTYAVGPAEYPGSANSSELVQHWHDICNAGNTWKYALLLYISRVFHWDRTDDGRLPEVTSLSMLVLDSARCCRTDSPLQKQLLFPVFWQAQKVEMHMNRSLSKCTAKDGIESAGMPCFERLWHFCSRSGHAELRK